jgi:hypothetical protein
MHLFLFGRGYGQKDWEIWSEVGAIGVNNKIIKTWSPHHFMAMVLVVPVFTHDVNGLVQ